MNSLVDAVVLWVDGSDPDWQKSREEHYEKFAAKYGLTCRKSNGNGRFVSCGELKYCLRGLHNFAPWLRRIHLVTNGQRPKWLRDHPKVRVVTHATIMDRECLPTFNSSAIEMNLHKIPDLTPVFLYLNDDFFVTRSLSRSMLFNARGQAYYRTYTPLSVKESEYYNSFSWIIRSDQLCLDRLFGKTERPRPYHQAFIVYKRAYDHLYRYAPDLARETSRQQFRPDSKCGRLSLNIYAVEAIGLELGLYQHTRVDRNDRQLQQYHTPESARANEHELTRNPPLFLCINDLSTREDRALVDRLMPKIIRTPAPWEK